MDSLTAKITRLLKHPVTKRLLIAIPLAVGIGLIRSWLGFEQSALIGLMSGIAAYFIADGIFLDPIERKNKLKSGVEFIKENVTAVVKYCLLLSVIAFFFGAHKKPSDPIISQIQQMVEIFGLLLVLIYPMFMGLYRAIVNVGLYRAIVNVGLYRAIVNVGRVISGIAVYSVVLWMIGQYGIYIKEWIMTNPNEALVAGVSFLLLWFILKISFKISN
ncbi:MAG: hypothetical protein RBR08_14560 [Desulforegulaceae bacterium]|nr:hypothetical protein [Desulforegulaceae bacterium]